MRTAGTVGLIYPYGDSASDGGGTGLAVCRDRGDTSDSFLIWNC